MRFNGTFSEFDKIHLICIDIRRTYKSHKIGGRKAVWRSDVLSLHKELKVDFIIRSGFAHKG